MRMIQMQVEIARMLIVLVRGRAAKARREGRSDLGASVLELAIIAAVLVTLAILVTGIVRGVVSSRTDEIQDGGN